MSQSNYHHGDLRNALIVAAVELILAIGLSKLNNHLVTGPMIQGGQQHGQYQVGTSPRYISTRP